MRQPPTICQRTKKRVSRCSDQVRSSSSKEKRKVGQIACLQLQSWMCLPQQRLHMFPRCLVRHGTDYWCKIRLKTSELPQDDGAISCTGWRRYVSAARRTRRKNNRCRNVLQMTNYRPHKLTTPRVPTPPLTSINYSRSPCCRPIVTSRFISYNSHSSKHLWSCCANIWHAKLPTVDPEEHFTLADVSPPTTMASTHTAHALSGCLFQIRIHFF